MAFAAGAVALLGLPHGASDLALVAQGRRASFLSAYAAAVVAVLALWLAAPVFALAAFLLVSAAHFSVDGRSGGDTGPAASWSVGSLLVAGPALLHGPALAALFEAVVHRPEVASALTTALKAVALVALVPVAVAVARRERVGGSSPVEVVAGLAATLALPPLPGFACGFVLLHARGQTAERQRRLGCPTLAAYVRRVAPVLLAATAVLVAVVASLARAGLGSTSTLFAVIAAFAVPHMAVTPLWERAGPRRTSAGRGSEGVTAADRRGRARPAWQPARSATSPASRVMIPSVAAGRHGDGAATTGDGR